MTSTYHITGEPNDYGHGEDYAVGCSVEIRLGATSTDRSEML